VRPALGVLLVVLIGCHPAATQGLQERAPTVSASMDAGSHDAGTPDVGSPDAGSQDAVAECSGDLDCAITHRLPNCCTGCAPRALPVSARGALEARCEGGDKACIQPLCRAPPTPAAAVCLNGRCEVRPGRTDRR
jgi:hypothetical protein